MIKKILPLLMVCFSVGVLAGCSSSDPLVSEAEVNIKNENYDAALAAAEKSIQQKPDNPLGYYFKGVALGNKAQTLDNPTDSGKLYASMDDAFKQAKAKASNLEESPEEINRIDAVKNSLWQEEHNRAVALATDDSLMKVTEKPLDLAISHLNNATVIQPDSSLSWQVLAQVNNMREDYGQAAKAQEKYIEITNNPEVNDYILLSQFFRLDEQPAEAARVLDEARGTFPENTKIVEALADTYSELGESEKAIATVEELAEQNPSNPQYRLSLGTQLYQSALQIQGNYDENLDQIFELQQQVKNAQGDQKQQLQNQLQNLEQENKELRTEIESLSDRAIVELNATIKNRPDEALAYNTLGIIYQNRAAAIFDQRNLTTDNQKAAELDKQAKAELKKAMNNYERAAEIEPDNPEYWRSLFQIYTALGMDEKAKEAEKKAGIQ